MYIFKSIEYKGYRKYTSCNGILYEQGDYDSNADYHSYNSGQWILVKYPPAKAEVNEIEFEKINKIADYAFEDFVGTDLYLENVPPICSEQAFHTVDVSKINIHVPKDSYNSYWMHPVWGQFNIIPE